MILCTLEGNRMGNPGTMRADHAINRGQWFRKYWLVYVSTGFNGFAYLVEAGCESDAIDTLVDSKHGAVIKTDERCDVCETQDKLLPEHRVYDECSCTLAGNYGDVVNLDNVSIWKVSAVDYFAKNPDKVTL